MSNTFFCSDHHFGHANILKFTKKDGSSLRVFDDVDHMNEYMVMQHNRVVNPKDKVYFLGDLAMHKKYLPILHRMNGEKVLIRGNHDLESARVYLDYFKDVRGTHQIDGMLLSHIPIHVESLSRWKANVHGHLHSNRVMLPSSLASISEPKVDFRYYSVCMEQLDDYTPVSLEQVKKNLLDLAV